MLVIFCIIFALVVGCIVWRCQRNDANDEFKQMLKQVRYVVDISEYISMPDNMLGFWYNGHENFLYENGPLAFVPSKNNRYEVVRHLRYLFEADHFFVFRKDGKVLMSAPIACRCGDYTLSDFVLNKIKPMLYRFINDENERFKRRATWKYEDS